MLFLSFAAQIHRVLSEKFCHALSFLGGRAGERAFSLVGEPATYFTQLSPRPSDLCTAQVDRCNNTTPGQFVRRQPQGNWPGFARCSGRAPSLLLGKIRHLVGTLLARHSDHYLLVFYVLHFMYV